MKMIMAEGLEVLLLLLSLAKVSGNAIKKYIIIPSNEAHASCPLDVNVSCLTIQRFTIETDNITDGDNVQLVVLPGNHSLYTDFFVMYVNSLTLMSSSSDPVRINCYGSMARFQISTIQSVHISGVNFVGCVDNMIHFVDDATLNDCTFTTSDKTNKTNGTGLIIFETNFQANRVVFQFLRGVSWQMHERVDTIGPQRRISGGAMVVTSHSNVTLIRCTFRENKAEVGGAIFIEHDSSISIDDCKFIYNIINCSGIACGYGGALFANSGSRLVIHNSAFAHNEVIPPDDGGVLSLFDGSAEIYWSEFVGNSAVLGDGVVFCRNYLIKIVRCVFWNNTASRGGALYTDQSIIHLNDSQFHQNWANSGGIVFATSHSKIIICNSMFTMNTVIPPGGSGGVVYSTDSFISFLNNSHFVNNTAHINGGVADVRTSQLLIMDSTFSSNSAFIGGGVLKISDDSNTQIVNSFSEGNKVGRDGGVINAYSSSISILDCNFVDNSADGNGGAIFASECDILFDKTLNFKGNSGLKGGAMYIVYGSVQSIESLTIRNSISCIGAVYLINSVGIFNGSMQIERNLGTLFIFNSKVKLSGCSMFTNNTSYHYSLTSNSMYDSCSTELGFQQEGTITVLLSTINVDGEVRLEKNTVLKGGGILAAASRLQFSARLYVLRNTVKSTGGGLYFYQSQVQFSGKLFVENNVAITTGGGIHSISSSLLFVGMDETSSAKSSKISIRSNVAKFGGGAALEFGSKIYALSDHKFITFSKNKADKGGAIFVADGSNSGACPTEENTSVDFSVECFLQWVSPSTKIKRKRSININQILSFSQNHARVSGGILYGGLLDRCKISPFHKYYYNFYNSTNMYSGVYFFSENGGVHDLSDIASEPVRICFCKGGKHDCSFHPPPVYVKKGESFPLTFVCVDQVNRSLDAYVHSVLTSGTLGEDQQVQKSRNYCTKIWFNVFSPLPQTRLLLYSEGPCNNTGISQTEVDIIFLPCTCAIGFQPSTINTSKCECECDARIYPYVTNCNVSTNSFTRKANFWISYIDANWSTSAEGYLLYPNCPVNYCYSPNIEIYVNLNEPNGSDSQCIFNRSGLLCSGCKQGLSLSLGSSRCIVCPSYWPALCTITVIGVCVGGMALVVFILMFNMTVATGTVNGLIFYANIVAVNGNPFGSTNLHSVFIDWMNLDFGFDVCLFDKLNAYAKVWLEIVFSLYLIILVVMVIIISERSTRFARLISRRNPIATLSTLILLSYTKLLQSVIKTLSFAVLTYPDGTKRLVWLADASVLYLKGKHIPLFFASVVVLVLVLTYTLLLFSWQWLLKLPNKRYFWWIRNTRFASFMDAYHAPYTVENRYWTGLLLFIRILLYLVAALNVSGEPSTNTLAVSASMCCLLTYICVLKKSIYKNKLVNTLELACYFHIIVLGIAKFHVLVLKAGDISLAYISVSISLVMFLGVTLYNVLHVTRLLNKLISLKKAKGAENFLQDPLLQNDETTPTVTFSVVGIEKESQTLSNTEM